MAKTRVKARSKKKVLTKRTVKKTLKKKSTMARKVKKILGKRKVIRKVAKKATKKLIRAAAGKTAKVASLGKVVHYYDRIQVAILELTAPIAVGDMITFRRNAFEHTQPVDSLQIDHVPVPSAKKGQVVGMKVGAKMENGTVAYKA